MTFREATVFTYFKHLRNLQLCSVLLVTLFTWSTNSQNKEESLAARLRYSEKRGDGIVEVYYQGEWGTICADYSWDVRDGYVLCRQLGFQSVIEVTWNRGPHPNNRTSVLEDMQCTGKERNVAFCEGNFGYNNCEPSQVAGLKCQPYEVRLMDGGKGGIVEVLTIYGKWGTICGNYWDVLDARVVCRQLGYAGVRDYTSYAVYAMFGPTLPILVDEIRCYGTEYRIQDCPATWGTISMRSCYYEEIALVNCLEESDIPDIRLVDGAYPNQGRVEIHIDKWGTICDDMWNGDEAWMVCRQLGYRGEAQAIVPEGTFPPGSGKILLDEVQCTGLEASIYFCSHQEVGRHDCDHSEDVGVVCLSDEYPNYAVPVYSVTPSWSPDKTGGLSGAMKTVIGVFVVALVLISLCLLCRYKIQKEQSTIRTNESLAQRRHSYAIAAPTVSLSGAESSERTGVFQQVQSDHPHSPAAPTAPPSSSELPFISDDLSTATTVLLPSAAFPSPRDPPGPDLPAPYDTFTENLDRFPLPVRQSPVDEATSASDLPPPYDTFIANPDRFPVPLGQSPTDEPTDVPVTPPPEYMPPPAMEFDSDANNEDLRNTSSTMETML